ncbi:protein PTHB1-like isoform X2 [Homarus americanus]|uniref:protein PTHB1-like isoform X2 n=1 Tax=Homarus americanus TaxID=6706 RepID=UPI001C43A61E|nr:protein PTHB1-like isoform X2 [Homarus americanus]
MSLFKARDWWSTVVEGEEGREEECDTGCLVIGNINNENPPKDKIVVGGFSGTLRVFSPQSYRSEEGEEVSGYRPDHVLLETTLIYPILQLAVGKFVSSNDLNHLCVLHPDRLVVYTISVASGQAGHGDHSRLAVAYQHKLQRNAHSFMTGPFGGVKGKEYLAVQSLDGCITVFEQESYAFSSFLPGFLLPGPIAYVAKSDALVTVSSDWCLQCFKYQAVAVATDNEKDKNSSNNNSKGGKRLSPEWTQQLGEPALDLCVLSPPEGPTSLLVLTHHAVFCFKESGVLKFVKKLEFNPSSFLAFIVDNYVHVCIASHTETLLVYRESQLKWASQLPFAPVALARANFSGITGALVMLGDSGQLHVSYMGTDPSLFVAPPTETREINYDQTDKELANLHKIIKASTKDTGALIGMNRGDSDLLVSGTVGTQLEMWTGNTRVQNPDGGVPAVPVVVRLTAHTPLNTVRVNIAVEKPLSVTQDTFVLRTICDTSQILVKFYLEDPYIPTNLSVSIITSYVTHTGIPRIITTNLDLPMRLVVKPSMPNKEADHKVTISTNKDAVSLPELFPDLASDTSVGTALGLQYYSGADITILSSRTTNRYRLQSDSLAALWITLSELIRRLKSYWSNPNRRDGEELILGVASSLPTHELFFEIDAHFLRRKKHRDLEAQLVQRATQFRAVQRRLLTKFKDKTPTPLTNLDNLLEGTYKQILQITDAINDNIRGLEKDGCQLSCVVRLVLELVRLQTNMPDHQYALLSSALSPIVHLSMDQGWEEITDVSVTFLLRTVLGRGSRDAPSTPELTMPSDTTKLKKHLGLLLDKVTKGRAQLTLKTTPTSAADTREDTVIGDEDDRVDSPAKAEEDPTDVPLGSRLGEDRARSARIRSARLLSARKIPERTPADGEPSSIIDDAQPTSMSSQDLFTDGNSDVNSRSHENSTSFIHQSSIGSLPDDSTTEDNEDNAIHSPSGEEADSSPPQEQTLIESTKILTENLKIVKDPIKENIIESPADIFSVDDGDDSW